MLSRRLESIKSFILKNDKVVDVGCDHGYLSIELYENKLCQSVIATDINESALDRAKKNIREKNLPIRTVLTDGLKNISTKDYDTVVISGMGDRKSTRLNSSHLIVKVISRMPSSA